MASQTRAGVAGMSMSLTPNGRSASSTALMTAGGEPMAPASPQPLAPSGLWLQGVTKCVHLEVGQVVGPRHGVVHEGAGQQLA
jgi:hypothetical protein